MADLLNIPQPNDKKLPKPDWIRVKAPQSEGYKDTRDLMRATQMAAKYFFLLPAATKREIVVNRAHRGYVPFAQTTLGRAYAADLKESFNVAFPFNADDPDVIAQKPLIGVNQWPAGDPLLDAFAEDLRLVASTLGGNFTDLTSRNASGAIAKRRPPSSSSSAGATWSATRVKPRSAQ